MKGYRIEVITTTEEFNLETRSLVLASRYFNKFAGQKDILYVAIIDKYTDRIILEELK